jgi:membrane-associated phospholipid phosphatase
MRTIQLHVFAVLALILGFPAAGRAQESTTAPSNAVSSQTVSPAPPAGQLETQGDEHPTPAHTGFAALAHSTWDDFKAFPRRKSTWVILGVGAGMAALAHPADDNVNARLVGSNAMGRFWAPGKYLGAAYTQAAVSVGLYTVGRYVVSPNPDGSRTNKWSHMGFDLLRAQLVSQAFVHGAKYAIRRDRPTGECCSFPSGHATTAFAAASVIERHFGYRMAMPTLLAATYVATSRLHDNRHFLSDVIFGAAIGTATGWTVVGRHGRSSYALRPVPVPGGVALELTHVDRGASHPGSM